MPSHALRLLRLLAVALLAGLCSSGSCTIAVSSDHDCCDDCLDCNDCGDCDCDECDDPAPPPLLAFEVLVVDADGAVHPAWAWADPAGPR